MKLQLEKEIFRHLCETLDEKYRSMLVMGHSTDDRPKPYISVDCEDETPFGDLPPDAGVFEIPTHIAVADSAHDIDFDIQDERILDIIEALIDFESQDPTMQIYSFEFSENPDARDDNNIGNVLSYIAIVQFL
jgi:hypothetical protein